MPVELECKISVASHDEVRERLRAEGAQYEGRVLETNRLFDREDGSLRRTDRGLRLRSVVTLDGDAPGATLAFKGPREGGGFKQREEIEVEVSDPTSTASLLGALGYAQCVAFEKRRETWRLGSCTVELDELPRLGCFVEIEGSDEPTIRSAMAALGLSEDRHVRESYVTMMAAVAADIRAGADVVKFQ
jgi:adenylate cyclase class 2